MKNYLKNIGIKSNYAFKTKIKENKKNEVLKKFMGNISIVYNNNEESFFVVICKNQTCSKKLKNLDEINKYIKDKIN